MKVKRMFVTVFAACMMLAMSTTAFAAESTSWKNYDYNKYVSNWSGNTGSSGSGNTSGWNWGGSSGWGNGSGSGWTWGNGFGWTWGGSNNPGSGDDEVVEEDTSLPAPEIGECRFIHQSLNAPDCLVVDWSDVEGAVSYEMEMCYSDCEVIQTYTMENSRFSVPAGRDDKNVTGCCRGRKIRVRAIDADGNAGKWSDYDTVGCNAIRG